MQDIFYTFVPQLIFEGTVSKFAQPDEDFHPFFAKMHLKKASKHHQTPSHRHQKIEKIVGGLNLPILAQANPGIFRNFEV